jgi:hypothetical protein
MAFGKKRKKAVFLRQEEAPEPTEFDWVYEVGPYMAFWVNQDPNGHAWLVGPDLDTGLKILVDGTDEVNFKNRLQFVVEKLAS